SSRCREEKGAARLQPGRPQEYPIGRGLHRAEIDRFGAAGVLLRVEADALALVERAQTGALNCGDMHEDVLAAAFGCNEPKAFGDVEEFDRSGLRRHSAFP